MAAQDSQSYLSKLSPWARSPQIPPNAGKHGEPESLAQQQGADHIVNHKVRFTQRNYPRDCPPLRPMWFHAVDSPKRRPNPAGKSVKVEKPPTPPKKYTTFSVRDSKAIEVAYRKLGEEQGAASGSDKANIGGTPSVKKVEQHAKGKTNLSLDEDLSPGKVRVPVNEDYLFDVDIERRELGPAYWLGPVYDVRRGSWFYSDSGTQRPCDENLAEQLEDGYLKVGAWRLSSQKPAQKSRASSQPRRPISWSAGPAAEEQTNTAASVPLTPQGSDGDLRKLATEHERLPVPTGKTPPTEIDAPQNTYRLFGSHMNSVVTYENATTAWLLTDDFMSRMNYNVYQRFAGGGHFGGVKLTRGYVYPAKKPDNTDAKSADEKKPSDSLSESSKPAREGEADEDSTEQRSPTETRRMRLERHMSFLLEEASSEDREKQAEEVRKRDEREMEEDYREKDDELQNREIEHLILVTHGIGQRLGLRIESVNFVHDINTFRKTLKAVYSDSPDLRALNAEFDKIDAVNSRIQVLPICWRHLLDFPKRSIRHNRKEHDLGDSEMEEEDYPDLEAITIEGVPAVRNLITDLALDILLYQSPAYKDHISRIVLEECNRIYNLFMGRNPSFKGKISLIGHSLGSAIMFDLLCHQSTNSHHPKRHSREHHDLKFDFEVDDFYALGSPIGLFQMLKGRTIVARQTMDGRKRAFSTSMDDPMLDAAANPTTKSRRGGDATATDGSISSPRCGQIFNIFHPTDPISYRIEPFISPSMSTLKPQPLPYTKRGLFDAPMGQGLTGLGSRVTQSVSSMWSNMASNLLTRGLGYTGSEQAQPPSTQQVAKRSGPLSITTPPSNIRPGAISDASQESSSAASSQPSEDRRIEVRDGADPGSRPPTLIDSEIETLYSGFEKRRRSSQSDAESRDLGTGVPDAGPEWQAAEERSRRLKREEEKVRRLNINGRVDYAIQEGAFEINLIAAIASHLSYWSDEDVSHFIISQLLSRRRVVVPTTSKGSGP